VLATDLINDTAKLIVKLQVWSADNGWGGAEQWRLEEKHQRERRGDEGRREEV